MCVFTSKCTIIKYFKDPKLQYLQHLQYLEFDAKYYDFTLELIIKLETVIYNRIMSTNRLFLSRIYPKTEKGENSAEGRKNTHTYVS